MKNTILAITISLLFFSFIKTKQTACIVNNDLKTIAKLINTYTQSGYTVKSIVTQNINHVGDERNKFYQIYKSNVLVVLEK